MKRSYFTAITLAIATLSAGHALAADPATAKTREQVRAELLEAQRTGNIVANAETGELLNQVYPGRYAA